jgi:hypothetical protein
MAALTWLKNLRRLEPFSGEISEACVWAEAILSLLIPIWLGICGECELNWLRGLPIASQKGNLFLEMVGIFFRFDPLSEISAPNGSP